MQLAESYPIFVNFGGPPHYLGLLKVHQKMPRLAERGKNNAGFCVLFEKSTPPPVVTNISYEQSACFCLQNCAQYGDLAIFSWTTTPIVPLVFELSVVEITVFLFFAFCKCKCKCSFFRSKEQPWQVYGLNWNMISIDYVLQFFLVGGQRRPFGSELSLFFL